MKSVNLQGLRGAHTLPAFNFYNFESFMAIKMASDELRAPVIFQTSESAMEYMGDEILRFLAEKYPLHLDHGHSLESVKHAISLGYKSVMIDGSHLPFSENVKLTRAAVKYAHLHNVWVEAELGAIDKNGDFTDPAQAAEFVKLTGCDSLAIAIGTRHGAHKGDSGKVKLRFDILSETKKLLPKTPLVLHGASMIPSKYTKILGLKDTSGVPAAQIKKAIMLGIQKVNIDSDARLAWTATIKQTLAKNPDKYNPRFFLSAANTELTELYKSEIRIITNCD